MFRDLKPYVEYHKVALPWLEEVPAHWAVTRAKNILRPIDVRSAHGDEELLTVSSARGVVPRSSASVSMFQAESYAGHKLCWPGDLVINSLWAWGRGLGVSRLHGIVSTAYGVYRPRSQESIEASYLNALARSDAFQWELQVRSRGVWKSRLQLTDDRFLGAPLLVPPAVEQAAIVKYLAHAHARMDRAIAAKRKLIALLEEQKQAIINQAVTRGLDPTVPMKDSGIPWLGQIPAHWELRRLKSVGTRFGSGLTPRGGGAVYQDTGIPLLRSQNVHFDGLRMDSVARIDRSTHEDMSGTHVRPGDVLLNITGASIGRACAVPETLLEANVNQHVCIIRTIRELCVPTFLALWLGTSGIQSEIRVSQNGSSREGLNSAAVKRLWLACPPVTEQSGIVDAVTLQLKSLGRTTISANREIGLLREFRTRLTSDVVTGQLDVREIAATLVDFVEAAPVDADSGEDESFDEFDEVLEEADA